MSTDPQPVHLGSGAYVNVAHGGGLRLTANHHDPDQATDRVYLDTRAVRELKRYLAAGEEPRTVESDLEEDR